MTDTELNSVALAQQSVSDFTQYLSNRIAACNADTDRPNRAGIDRAAYFSALGNRAKGYWLAHGRRIAHLFNEATIVEMSAGATQPAATLTAWAKFTKPAVVYALLNDGTVVPTTTAFPTGTPLSSWSIQLADTAALAALTAQGDSAVLAALVAAQPSV